MKARNFLIAAALSAAFAVSAFAALSSVKADWGKGPAQYIMTKEEQAQWKSLQSDADADAFIALFWARRDPTPGTPRNEFREEFDARVAAADAAFKGARTNGSMTDRGRVFILFGKPTRITKSGGRGSGPGAAPGSAITPSSARNESMSAEVADPNGAMQTWIYEGTDAKAFGGRQEVMFSDRFNSGDFKMRSPTADFQNAVQKVIASNITQPGLTQASAMQAQQAPMPAAAAAALQQPAAPTTALKTAAYESAVTDAKGGKSAAKVAGVTYAELVSPNGDYYVPVSLYIPASAGVKAEDVDTVFGVVEDASGNRVLAFEEPAKLQSSKGDLYIDKTLSVTPASGGKYTAVVGVAKAGVPVTASSATLNLSPLTKDAVGTSRMLLSGDIHETTDAAPVKAPFAFGKLKVVPKGSLSFTNKEELNYFVEINNPGIDTTTNLPKIQVKLDLVTPDKKMITAPLGDASPLPLSGAPGPGHYAIISSIPFGDINPPLKPGDYTLKLKIVDTVTKQSYTLEQAFKITG
jgi:GWxTD domain-containing protein